MMFLVLALWTALALAGPEAMERADALLAEAIELYGQARYEEAYTRIEERLELVTAARGPDDLQVGECLRQLGILDMELGRYDAALDRLEQARRIAVLPGVPVDLESKVLQNIGSVLSTTGRYVEAEAVQVRSLELARASDDPGREFAAMANLALTLEALARWDEGAALLEQVLAFERANGAEPADIARTLLNLAAIRIEQHRLDEAEQLANEGLAIYAEVLGPKHPNAANARTVLATLARKRGEYDEALKLREEAVAIYVDAYGPDHPVVHTERFWLAAARYDAGYLRESQALLEQSLAELRTADAGVGVLASAQGLLALLRGTYGDYQGALDLWEEARPGLIASLGADHPVVLYQSLKLAETHAQMGHVGRARQLTDEALPRLREALGADHPWTIDAMATAAAVARSSGDHALATSLYRERLAALEKLVGPVHPDVIGARLQLVETLPEDEHRQAIGALVEELERRRPDSTLARALLARAEVEPQRAIEDATRAAALISDRVGPRHQDVLYARTLVARETLRTDPRRAADLLQALIDEAHQYGASPWATTGPLMYLSVARHRSGASGADALAAATDQTLDALSVVLASSSQRQRFNVMIWAAMLRDVALEVHEEPEDAWTALQVWRGAGRRAVLATEGNLDPELVEVRRQVAALTYDEKLPEPVRAELLREAVERRERIERAHASEAGTLTTVRLDEVCDALDGAALVDVVRWSPVHGEPRYAAFVVDRSCDVHRFALGEGLDAAVAHWRALIANPETVATRLERAGARVRELAWNPLALAVAGHERIVLAADGSLHGVSFAALPLDDGRYLVEEHEITYLSDAAVLLRDAPGRGRGALVVGGVDFGGVRGGGCLAAEWPPLPGTVQEMERVRARLGRGVETLTGGAATESAVAAAASGKRIVHVASHGFFASNGCRSASAPYSTASPLVLGGLVLAAGEGGDGIWTGEEVATTRLDSVDLVVLSACETGLGEVKDGQGVAGLRLALAAAGVRSVVMSLWSVGDLATAELMDRFYRAHRRLPPAAALRRAQLEMLADRRDQDPRSWAAFVVSGG